ncbi:hybrid sensor histidine kinase/response regulator transcription factor, partial [Xylanibacter caecicola]|uniref:hybrid sensor histidine kinase/response regulator transcription factor n=2 Tax=Xylanibacter caecicola TaxID=2736294 RepID=UPI002582FA5B
RDIAFNLELPKEHVKMWCDAEKIGIVVNNLINNAFKYTQEGGTICVALEAHDNGTCRIRVEDNGVGIPESQLVKIFERFSQADNKISDDTTHAGTGIGLSLSKEYVNMHHGRIWAENLESGVAFIVEMPTDKEHFGNEDTEVYFDDSTAENNIVQAPGLAEHVSDKKEEINDDAPTLLLIEDNIDLCHMLQLQLKRKYNVFVAHNGEDGLKKIYQYHPDVIITDLMMPGIDGMELLSRVRHDFIISHIPVIILTAKHNDDTKTHAITAGANAYITKPFSSEYLMARIHQLLEEQRIFQRKMVVHNTVENKQSVSKDEYEQHLVKKDVEFVHKIHEIIEQNLNANDFNIDTIAETIGLSRSAFFKKLKSLTGLAPVNLVKEVRLSKAAGLIETTDNNITEIAYSVGFHDAGYFGKCFRKKYGMTPKEYRKEKTESKNK